ncbi:hypothetical protein CEXT_810171 [Caerostris extrusa]|uniref:Uncharacterized protein n=1 Tax=Caerostris extrusa TaxID=172846 RepID=A0AAV4V6K2_CAEEX|nr:hypothetical protein CEXT_810171 [Caerostris extrusa]
MLSKRRDLKKICTKSNREETIRKKEVVNWLLLREMLSTISSYELKEHNSMLYNRPEYIMGDANIMLDVVNIMQFSNSTKFAIGPCAYILDVHRMMTMHRMTTMT